jgi:hypothetical protein
MIVWAIARPWPVPRPTGLVVKKGSNTRSVIAAGIPHPVSLTVIRTRSLSTRVRIRIVPLCCESSSFDSFAVTSGSSPRSSSMSATYVGEILRDSGPAALPMLK